MPPRRLNSEDEISLRHLPDTSDASFSFQIPNPLSGDVHLLDEDDTSFFRDVNDDDVNSTTPGTEKSDLEAFTLEELTTPVSKLATANHRNHSSQPLPACSGSQAPLNSTSQAPEQAVVTRATLSKGKVRPNLKQNTQASAEAKSSAITRLEGLRAEFEVLHNETPDSSDQPPHTNIAEPSPQNEPKAPSNRRELPAMKTERLRPKAVISGGIVKTQSKKAASSSRFARSVPSVPAIQQQASLPPETQSRILSDNADFLHPGSPDISICATAPGGVAERLLMYSETLLSSFGPATVHDSDIAVPAKDDPESSTQRRNSIAENPNAHYTGAHDLLTLSQISPSKAADSHPSPAATVLPDVSPMRRLTKRPASAPSSPQPVAKKGRSLAVTSDDASAFIAPTVWSDGLHAPTKSSNSGSSSQGAKRAVQQTRGRRRGSTPTRQEPSPTTTVSTQEDVQTNLLSRSDTTGSSLSTLRFSRSDNLATSGTSASAHGEAGSSSSMGMPRHYERSVLPPANTTKPVGFKFQIDARIEARKAEFEKEKLLASQKPRKQNYQVPDFKTIHAVEEARLALRKENIVPTVPLPFQLTTDGRAREREKFEAHLREKERESRRVLEEKRREEEQIEERAIKELRKKAVPRAHEVPEWYKEVPKRKVRDLDTNGD
ncbi:hypothetical protein C0995_003380 [Termitomyces sp. Mi166|nr:hypothetical protein C0995_003380 [Termitomyces sp. Mi166\